MSGTAGVSLSGWGCVMFGYCMISINYVCVHLSCLLLPGLPVTLLRSVLVALKLLTLSILRIIIRTSTRVSVHVRSVWPIIEKVSLRVRLPACFCARVLNIDVGKCGGRRMGVNVSVCTRIGRGTLSSLDYLSLPAES